MAFEAKTQELLYQVYIDAKRGASVKHRREGKAKKFFLKTWLMIRFYLFCIGWLWKNRNWDNNRHKFRSMNREWEKSIKFK